MTEIDRIAPVLPVRDVAAALDRFKALGFEVLPYADGWEYGFATRDGAQLHVALVSELDPSSSNVSVYLYVNDADALVAEWRAAGVAGRFHDPVDTDYGLREGAYVDPDGNLFRFGSPLSGQAEARG
jgi:catechol 2,3-dioxygenase-like lactoylglutathione lyase family enzyme